MQKEPYWKQLTAISCNFKMDFAKAYTGVDSLVANYEMKENGIRISYEAKGIHDNNSITG